MLKIKNNHNKDDKASQIVSWGHWFTLLNIFFVIILGSRYLFIADWPTTFIGRFYAIISTLGHFSFLTFALYLILIFPLSFILHSPRWIKIITSIIATLGLTLLLIDIEVFSRFRMHLNLTIWDILTSTEDNLLSRDWQTLFIFVPLIFFVEIVFASWIWKKLRSLSKRRKFARPIVIVFISSFLFSHLIHIWADANFYRPITMQKASLPLSYPLTAQHFLEKYGLLNPNDYDDRVQQEGNPFAMAVEYPLSKISVAKQDKPYNLLMIVVDTLQESENLDQMPFFKQFAQQNIQFKQHYSASNKSDLGMFSLFYGLDANYYNSILANHQSSVLLNTISKQRYNLGLFSSEGFSSPLYRYALLSDFSLSKPVWQSNKTTSLYWQQWLESLQATETPLPWFSLVYYQMMDQNPDNKQNNTKPTLSITDTVYQNKLKQLDDEFKRVIEGLSARNELDQTVIVITSAKGLLTQKNQVILNNHDDNFTRSLLQVPLVIHWPGKAAQEISLPTTHTDVMRTLMQDLLNTKTTANQYSQGENLFELPERSWLIAGNEEKLAAIYADKTIVINSSGHYKIYDVNSELLEHEKLDLATFLKLITANRRFMVTN